MPSSASRKKGPGSTSLQHYYNSPTSHARTALGATGTTGSPQPSYREARLPGVECSTRPCSGGRFAAKVSKITSVEVAATWCSTRLRIVARIGSFSTSIFFQNWMRVRVRRADVSRLLWNRSALRNLYMLFATRYILQAWTLPGSLEGEASYRCAVLNFGRLPCNRFSQTAAVLPAAW